MDEERVKKIINGDLNALKSNNLQEHEYGQTEKQKPQKEHKNLNDLFQESSNERIEKSEKTKKPKKEYSFRLESSWFAFFAIFGAIFTSFICIFQVVLTPIKVVGRSMQPTINASVESDNDTGNNDIVYYKTQDSYNNYDIVIIANPNQKYVVSSGVECIIKRVVATGGQTIRFYLTENSSSNSTIYYYSFVVLDENGNDIDFDNSYILEDMYFEVDKKYKNYINIYGYNFPTYLEIFGGMMNSPNGIYEYAVAEGKYFVMGDNRNNSEDSRFFGCVDSEDIYGAVKIIVPYGKNIWQIIILSKKFICSI